jgi:hypothetical protein
MNNLKYAKIFLGLGLVVGGSVPVIVITNQNIASARRKEGILKDQERIKKKLSENPNLTFKTDTSILPINDEQLGIIMKGKD